MKRFTTSVVMAAVLGVAAYSVAGAQGPGRGWGSGPRADGMGAGRGAQMMLRGLDLTDQQQEQVRAVREAQRGTREAALENLRLHRDLRSEIFAEAPDPQRIAALQQQITQEQADRFARQLETEQQVAQVLTTEQRATVRERLAQAPARGEAGARRSPVK